MENLVLTIIFMEMFCVRILMVIVNIIKINDPQPCDSRMVELYIHYTMHLHGTVVN
jgi:hypothetical protein